MKNEKRAANRRESQREHSEEGFRGSRGTETRSSGSPAHRNERSGPGEAAGAGMLEGHDSPGSSQETRATMGPDAYPSRATPGASVKASRYDEE